MIKHERVQIGGHDFIKRGGLLFAIPKERIKKTMQWMLVEPGTRIPPNTRMAKTAYGKPSKYFMTRPWPAKIIVDRERIAARFGKPSDVKNHYWGDVTSRKPLWMMGGGQISNPLVDLPVYIQNYGRVPHWMRTLLPDGQEVLRQALFAKVPLDFDGDPTFRDKEFKEAFV